MRTVRFAQRENLTRFFEGRCVFSVIWNESSKHYETSNTPLINKERDDLQSKVEEYLIRDDVQEQLDDAQFNYLKKEVELFQKKDKKTIEHILGEGVIANIQIPKFVEQREESESATFVVNGKDIVRNITSTKFSIPFPLNNNQQQELINFYTKVLQNRKKDALDAFNQSKNKKLYKKIGDYDYVIGGLERAVAEINSKFIRGRVIINNHSEKLEKRPTKYTGGYGRYDPDSNDSQMTSEGSASEDIYNSEQIDLIREDLTNRGEIRTLQLLNEIVANMTNHEPYQLEDDLRNVFVRQANSGVNEVEKTAIKMLKKHGYDRYGNIINN